MRTVNPLPIDPAPVSNKRLPAAVAMILYTVAVTAVLGSPVVRRYRTSCRTPVKPLIHLFLTCENGWMLP